MSTASVGAARPRLRPLQNATMSSECDTLAPTSHPPTMGARLLCIGMWAPTLPCRRASDPRPSSTTAPPKTMEQTRARGIVRSSSRATWSPFRSLACCRLRRRRRRSHRRSRPLRHPTRCLRGATPLATRTLVLALGSIRTQNAETVKNGNTLELSTMPSALVAHPQPLLVSQEGYEVCIPVFATTALRHALTHALEPSLYTPYIAYINEVNLHRCWCQETMRCQTRTRRVAFLQRASEVAFGFPSCEKGSAHHGVLATDQSPWRLAQ